MVHKEVCHIRSREAATKEEAEEQLDSVVPPCSARACRAGEPRVAYSHGIRLYGAVCAGASGGDSGTGRDALTCTGKR